MTDREDRIEEEAPPPWVVVLGRALLDAEGGLWYDRGNGRVTFGAHSSTEDYVRRGYGPVREVLLVSPAAGRVLEAAQRWHRAEMAISQYGSGNEPVADEHDRAERALFVAVGAMFGEQAAAMVSDRPPEPVVDVAASEQERADLHQIERVIDPELRAAREPVPEPDSDPGWERADVAAIIEGWNLSGVSDGSQETLTALLADRDVWASDAVAHQRRADRAERDVGYWSAMARDRAFERDGARRSEAAWMERAERAVAELAEVTAALLADRDRLAAEVTRTKAAWWKMQAFRDKNADGMIALIEKLRAELAEVKRCDALCRDVESERDRYRLQLAGARSELETAVDMAKRLSAELAESRAASGRVRGQRIDRTIGYEDELERVHAKLVEVTADRDTARHNLSLMVEDHRKLSAELAEHRQLFELQWTRTGEAEQRGRATGGTGVERITGADFGSRQPAATSGEANDAT